MKYNVCIFAFFLAFTAGCSGAAETKRTSLAGTWYPADASELSGSIDKMLSIAGKSSLRAAPLVLIAPHAGYQYSGKVAAAGYSSAKNARPDIIVILGPSHRSAFGGCSVLPVDFFETPLGKIRVDKDIAKRLLSARHFRKIDRAHDLEHSLEIHLPFIQRTFMERMEHLAILPVLVGDIDAGEARDIAKTILDALRGKAPLFIVSSDFTHYGPRFGYVPFSATDDKALRDKIKKLDYGAIDFILKKDLAGFNGYVEKTQATICGRNPLMIALALPVKNFYAEIISYDTSGDITGDFSNSVSYAAIALCGGFNSPAGKGKMTLMEEDKKYLLNLARRNIKSVFENANAGTDPESVPANCSEKAGAFVTLKKGGRLRGCIGYVEALKPLYLTVMDNSYNAAFRDPRFSPLRKDELGEISIEISVLTEPVPVQSIDEIAVGRDGVIVEKGGARGLFLPQVAVEQGWDRSEFLMQVCRKAGLDVHAWKDKDSKLYTFQAIVFGE